MGNNWNKPTQAEIDTHHRVMEIGRQIQVLATELYDTELAEGHDLGSVLATASQLEHMLSSSRYDVISKFYPFGRPEPWRKIS